jgi:hypothetical protein
LALEYHGGPARRVGFPALERDVVLMARSCPISKDDFFSMAEPLKVEVNGIPMLAELKAFSTGSFGWFLNAKTTVTVDGKAIPVQIGANFTVVGSKEAVRETG